MTDITLLRGRNMVSGLAGCQGAIMTAGTAGNDAAVVEIDVGPVGCRHMAGIALTRGLDMAGMFTGCGDPVMTG